MIFLKTGMFFGDTNREIRLDGITLTDTEYTHAQVDWHYHENAHFTFILQGKLIEGNKKQSYNCENGSLLFHSWQEPHYNIKPPGYTRGFHVEFSKQAFAELGLETDRLQGSFKIEDPNVKLRFYRLFRETKMPDDLTAASVQMGMVDIFKQMLGADERRQNKRPAWVKKLREILHEDRSLNPSLKMLANELNIHPVHLSRYFSKYFHCTLSEYVRKLRVERSLSLLPDRNLSLTTIAFECGFADQSHFLRCFKEINGVNPSEYRKMFPARC